MMAVKPKHVGAF